MLIEDPCLCMVGEDRLRRILGTEKFFTAYRRHHSLLCLPEDEELEEYKTLLSVDLEAVFSTPSLFKTPPSEIKAWLDETGCSIQQLLATPSLLETEPETIMKFLDKRNLEMATLVQRPALLLGGVTALDRMWPTWRTPNSMHPDDQVAIRFAANLPTEIELEQYASAVEAIFPAGVVSENSFAPVWKMALAFTYILTGENSFPMELFTIILKRIHDNPRLVRVKVWQKGLALREVYQHCMKIDSPVSWNRFWPFFDEIFLRDDDSWYRAAIAGQLPEVSAESTPRRELTARREALADAGQSLTADDGNFKSTVKNYLEQAQCGYTMLKSNVNPPGLPLLLSSFLLLRLLLLLLLLRRFLQRK
jgi:hypothetical protein